MFEFQYAVVSPFHEFSLYLFGGKFFIQSIFRVIFVGIANKLFFNAFGNVVTNRKWQVVQQDIINAQPGTGVAFTYQGVPFIALLAHKICT